jgi:hypothetical protein
VEAMHQVVGLVPDLPCKRFFPGRSGTCPTLVTYDSQLLK